MAKTPPRRPRSNAPRGRVSSRETRLIAALRRICSDLVRAKARFAVVGGLAVSTRVTPRLTDDVDVAVAVGDDAEAEAIVQGMIRLGYQVESAIEHVPTDRLAMVRLASPAVARTLVDLLFATSGIEPEVVGAAEMLEIAPGLTAPVARIGHLIAMKLISRDDRDRPEDHADLVALAAIAPAAERRRVEAAIALIAKRKHARGRDLEALWRGLSRPPRKSSLRPRVRRRTRR